MGVRKYLIVPQLVIASARAPRDQKVAWQRYWSSVERTGSAGDVLWDAGERAELDGAVERLRAHADLTLPLVDLGCGNGRQARALTRDAPHVLGVDHAAAAVQRARAETLDDPPPGPGTVDFRVADVTEPGMGEHLRGELGEVNVHVRGVLHVVEPADRPTVVANLAAMIGGRGTAYMCETNLPGDPLDYLIFQGATPLTMPHVLRRLVAGGLRAPSHFGAAEVADSFPGADGWRVLDAGPTTIYGVPHRPGDPPQKIPGYYAVLRRSFPGDRVARGE